MTVVAGQKLRASSLNPPFGHAGITSGFVTASATNGIYPTLVAQELRNGMTFAGNGLVVPRTALYEITVKGYYTGGSSYAGAVAAVINSTTTPPPASANAGGTFQTWKADSLDYQHAFTVRRSLSAGDVVRLWTKAGGDSTYGSTGYDGAWLEVLAVEPA